MRVSGRCVSPGVALRNLRLDRGDNGSILGMQSGAEAQFVSPVDVGAKAPTPTILLDKQYYLLYNSTSIVE